MIVVDFSQICIAAYMKFAGEKYNKDVDMEVFRHVSLNSLRAINMKFRATMPGSRMVLALDSPNSWRKQYFPFYKVKRTKEKSKSNINWPLVYQSIATIIEELRESFPFQLIAVPGAEADDIIGSICRWRTSILQPTVIVSRDHDFVQLQIDNSLVKQWNNIASEWVVCEDPKKKLFEHVIRGDSGDSVPNVLSEDNVFAIEGGRQKKIMTTALERWWAEGIDFNVVNKTKLKRNITLVDLRKTPQPIYDKVVKEIQSFDPPKVDLLSYMIKHQLRELAMHIGDFR